MSNQPGRRSINKSGSKPHPPTVVTASVRESVDELGTESEESAWKPLNLKNGDIPKPKPATKGGWADSRSSRRGLDDPDDDRRLHMTQDAGGDSDPDIPMIPELDDQPMMTSREDHVVIAPLVAVNRITTYKELDNELTKHVSFLTLDNEIDLKLLTRGLCSEAELKEDDVAWDWDQLFTEVSSELTTEWDHQAQLEDKFSLSLLL